jgi:hypothetical protein
MGPTIQSTPEGYPGRMRILFFDDDPLRHRRFAFEARGHELDHSWFIDDAVRRIAERRYDLVCLDHDLETEGFDRSGLDVARFVRRMPAGRRPKAVFIHSWNPRGADRMYEVLRPVYRPGVSLLRGQFGSVAIPLSRIEARGSSRGTTSSRADAWAR